MDAHIGNYRRAYIRKHKVARSGSYRVPRTDSGTGARTGNPRTDSGKGARSGSYKVPRTDSGRGARTGNPRTDSGKGARSGSYKVPRTDSGKGARRRWLNATRPAEGSRHGRRYTESLGNVITIDDERIKNHLDRVVRGSVEETLNALLDAEADRLCNAQRYERSEARRDTRAGHYERKLQTKAGEVRLKVPKLRQQTFETAIIERYRRRESSVEEALIEMYLAGVSVRRVEDITEALWGTRVSPSTVSDLNKKIYGTIEAWRNRPIEGEHPLRLSGRHRAQAQLGWRGSQRLAAGRDRRQRRRLSGDSRHLRRGEGGQGGLERIPQAPQGAWSQRRPADHLGCLTGACRERGRVLSRSSLAKMHRALVPQHLQSCALHQGAGNCGDAQGDPRQRGHRGGA